MKSPLNLWLLLLVLLFSCGKNPEKQARELVGRSIAAHGGAEAWEKITTLKFRKKTRLLAEDGAVESELDQRVEIRMKPYLEGKITWEKDSMTHVLTWDRQQMRYFMGENEIRNLGFLASKRKEFDAAFFEVSQPWGILDELSAPRYEGLQTLENGREAEVVQLDSAGGAELSLFYFDPKSAVMIGRQLTQGNSRALIYYLGYAEVEGLKLQAQSESWEVDENGKKRFLRAEFLYSEYEVLR